MRVALGRLVLPGLLALTAPFAPAATPTAHAAPAPPFASTAYRLERLASPDRTRVLDAATGAWVATLTDGAYTVRFAGPPRTFTDPYELPADGSVTTSEWVRVLPAPFDPAAGVNEAWVTARRRDTSDDVLAIAMQYIHGAPAVVDAAGVQIAGEASYSGTTGGVGSDFVDYLGVEYMFDDGSLATPRASRLRSLDCSGYIRMVWGYRGGLPMAASGVETSGDAIPRVSQDQFQTGPGVVLIDDNGVQPDDLSPLRTGDLAFFKFSDRLSNLTHVGLVMGRDAAGRLRVLSSRDSSEGPTMGDHGTKSYIGASGTPWGDVFMSRTWRAARRF